MNSVPGDRGTDGGVDPAARDVRPADSYRVRGVARLRFADPAVEAQFRAAYADKTIAAMRFAVLAGIALFLVFGLLDATVVASADLARVRVIRFGVVLPLLALAAGLLRVPVAPRFCVEIAATGVFIAGLGVVFITLNGSSEVAVAYYPGLLLVQVFAYTVMQLPFAVASAVGWSVTLVYDAVALSQGFDGTALLWHNFFLLSGNFAGMVGAWFIERLRRRDFSAQRVLSDDRTQLARLARELEVIAQRDPLTGLLNRRQLDERLRHALDLHQRYGVDTSLVLVDLDGFKDVNDTYGHPGGDALLVACAGALARCTRAADQVFRYGGDEFLIVAPETPTDVAVHISGRIQEAFGALDVVGADACPGVACSIGVGSVHSGDADPADLLGRVDAALYAAKREGKARTVVAPAPSP
ncbi:MAG: hypothetical protein CVU56_19070 [Deltaproteobacteria bacterium HGW-Deltaproteobacteria-14]|jgi:diguanylate cyclase (GGDEF)-like protein|nr:MAG: hypothetical protein CVU56_19070 [Deltaproteobacteria bacterium HGW-Deltaproteobacteria-14]